MLISNLKGIIKVSTEKPSLNCCNNLPNDLLVAFTRILSHYSASSYNFAVVGVIFKIFNATG